MPGEYGKLFRDRAVRVVSDRLYGDRSLSQSAVIGETALRLGIANGTLRLFCFNRNWPVAAGGFPQLRQGWVWAVLCQL